MGFASLLHTEIEENSPFKDYTRKIIKSSQTAADLTQALLAFSRKQPISQKPVNINEIVRQSEALLSKLIREDIVLTTALTDADTTVMADVGQIEQSLMNLVTNARDAMPDGGNLRICTEVMEMDDAFIKLHGYGIAGRYVHIAVSDTGMGMDENTKLRVFEPFFTTKEVGKGTGLGLASVYGIVKQHSGYIAVDSEPGKGLRLTSTCRLLNQRQNWKKEKRVKYMFLSLKGAQRQCSWQRTTLRSGRLSGRYLSAPVTG